MASTDPLDVVADDLRLYMGVDDIDDARADLLLDSIISLCEAIVTPLTEAAKPVVLSATARAYANPPGGVTSELVGPYQASRPAGGIYLTKGERAALRRSNASGGSFAISTIPATASPWNSWPQAVYSPLDGLDYIGDYDQIPT